MPSKTWQQIRLSSGNEDHVWELFHENSKIGRHGPRLSDEEVRERMSELHEALSFDGYPVVDLPRKLAPVKRSLTQAILTRASTRDMTPGRLDIKQVATLLHCAYGITRDNAGT